MSRGITAEQLEILNNSEVFPITLVELETDTAPIYAWSGYGNLKYDGKEYIGVGELGKAKPVKETKEVKAEKTVFIISGVPSEAINKAMEEPYQGRPARKYLSFVNDDGQIIIPPILLFSGFMDKMDIDEKGSHASINVTAESRFRRLKQKNNRRYTNPDQQNEYPDDRFLEFVPEMQDLQLEFGPA